MMNAIATALKAAALKGVRACRQCPAGGDLGFD